MATRSLWLGRILQKVLKITIYIHSIEKYWRKKEDEKKKLSKTLICIRIKDCKKRKEKMDGRTILLTFLEKTCNIQSISIFGNTNGPRFFSY